MTVSMRVVYAGKGYRYLLRSVAVGDGDRKMADPLTRYYSEEGTPPGRWMGTGVSGFGDGHITPGSTVTEAQLVLLLGMGRDPVTGEQLGRAFAKFTSVNDRIATRTANLSPDLTPQEREAEVARIEAEETERGSRHAVSGFDFTFSVPKSVSVLWGVADAGTQALIADAHHAAVAQVLDFIEREVAATRIGITAGDGPVAQVAVDGVAATAYDHWDSRAGDPQLHTHVVISVKARAARDGRWRALDSRPMHAATVAVSELYNAVLADRLTGTFGLEWDARERGANRNPAWEITGVDEDLIGEFSSRSREIDQVVDEMVDDYVSRHGRRPSAETIVRMRAEATLTTRPEKHIRSLADLTADWRTRADRILGRDSTGWSRRVTTGPAQRALRADDVPLDLIGEVGRSVVERVSEKRSTWRHWNLAAEASRQMMGWRFATMADREQVLAMVIDAAQTRLPRPDPARTGDQPGRVPPRRRKQRVPAPPLRRVLLSPDPRRRGPAPGPSRRHNRPDRGHRTRRAHHLERDRRAEPQHGAGRSTRAYRSLGAPSRPADRSGRCREDHRDACPPPGLDQPTRQRVGGRPCAVGSGRRGAR